MKLKSLKLNNILKLCGLMAAVVLMSGSAVAQQSASSELILVHRLDPSREAALQQLAARFNEQQKNYRVTVRSGGLTDAPPPSMLLLDGADRDSFLEGKPRYKALYSMMSEAGLPLKTAKPPASMTRTAVDAKGRLLALPVGLSTPVLFVNRKALAGVGLNPDMSMETWGNLQQVLDRLFDGGSTCPYTVSQPGRVMIDNTSAWHNESLGVVEKKVLKPRFNGMLNIKHVAMMSSWYRAKFMRIYDSEAEAEAKFMSGECAVIAAPSSKWTSFRQNKGLDVGVRPLPYHDDVRGAPQNTLADGPALWFAAGKTKAQYKVMAAFVDFWLKPENQIIWQRDSGYLPLNRAGLFAAQSDLIGDEFANVQVAAVQLLRKPATADSAASTLSDSARIDGIIDAALSDVWAERKPVKLALDEAVALASQPPTKAK